MRRIYRIPTIIHELPILLLKSNEEKLEHGESPSTTTHERSCIVEELHSKQSHMLHLKGVVHKVHEALREECSTLRHVAATHVLSASCNDLYKDLMRNHSNKICRLISKKFDVYEHIKNISSYRLSLFEKLVI